VQEMAESTDDQSEKRAKKYECNITIKFFFYYTCNFIIIIFFFAWQIWTTQLMCSKDVNHFILLITYTCDFVFIHFCNMKGSFYSCQAFKIYSSSFYNLFRLHAWGDSLEEALENCVVAMFGYMTEVNSL